MVSKWKKFQEWKDAEKKLMFEEEFEKMDEFLTEKRKEGLERYVLLHGDPAMAQSTLRTQHSPYNEVEVGKVGPGRSWRGPELAFAYRELFDEGAPESLRLLKKERFY